MQNYLEHKKINLTHWNHGDAISFLWHHGTWSTLVQVMTSCLTAPSHYLNQCWLSIIPIPTNCNEILFKIKMKIYNLSSRKMHLQMSTTKWLPFSSGFNVFNRITKRKFNPQKHDDTLLFKDSYNKHASFGLAWCPKYMKSWPRYKSLLERFKKKKKDPPSTKIFSFLSRKLHMSGAPFNDIDSL